MSGQQIIKPEISSVHDVKILLCYIMERLDRPVTAEQLAAILDDSGVISYFYFTDALEELIENGSLDAQEISSDNGGITRKLTLTEKGRLGSEYFNRYIHITFRRKLLRAAFSFFARLDREAACSCETEECDKGFKVSFTLDDGSCRLLDMSVYAPDKEQAEYISQRIKANPAEAYKKILGYLLDNPNEEQDIDKYL